MTLNDFVSFLDKPSEQVRAVSLCSIKNKKIIMMKKTYINPNMRVVTMKTQQMMMLSAIGTTEETSGNLGRDYDFEDEEW